jgi:hypothetical protein
MTKAVLITKIGSIYDDLPEERYHFPRQYLGRMEACHDDWIVYYEPGRLTDARRQGGLVSVDDDHTMLVAHDQVPDTIGRLLNESGRLSVPLRSDFQPNARFLKYHRDNIFKG